MVILGFRGSERQPGLFDTVSREKGKDGKGRSDDGKENGGIKDRGGEGTGGQEGRREKKPQPHPQSSLLNLAPRTQSPLYNVLSESSRHPPFMLLP